MFNGVGDGLGLTMGRGVPVEEDPEVPLKEPGTETLDCEQEHKAIAKTTELNIREKDFQPTSRAYRYLKSKLNLRAHGASLGIVQQIKYLARAP